LESKRLSEYEIFLRIEIYKIYIDKQFFQNSMNRI